MVKKMELGGESAANIPTPDVGRKNFFVNSDNSDHWTSKNSAGLLFDHEDTSQRVYNVKKSTVGTLNAGELVYLVGQDDANNVITAELAKADSETTMNAVAVMVSSATDTVAGTAISAGTVGSMATSGFTAGDELFVSPSVAGSFTKVRPTGTGIVQSTGIAGNIDASDGTIVVNISGNIYIAPGGADTSVQFNNSNFFGGDSNFQYDTTNKILKLTAPSSNDISIAFLNSSLITKGTISYDDGTDVLKINPTNTLKTLQIGAGVFVVEGSDDTRIDIEPVLGTGCSLLTLSNNGGGTGLQLEFNDAVNNSSITGEIGTLTISTITDDLVILSSDDASLTGDNLSLVGSVTASMISPSIDIESTTGSLDLRADASYAILAGSTACSIEAEGGVASIVATSGNVLLNPQTAGYHTQISSTNSLVTTPVIELLNSVTDVDIYVSNASPEGVITAAPGSICFTINGVNSKIYQLESASSSNTGWEAAAGNVDGPSSSVDNAIVTFDGTTGKLIQEAGRVTLDQTTAATNLVFDATVAAPTQLLKLNDSNGAQAFRIRRQTDTGGVFVDNHISTFNIRQLATGGSLLLSSSDGNIQITPPSGSQTVVNTQSRFANNGTVNDFRVRIPAADGEAVISLESAVSTPVLELKYDDDTGDINITGDSGTLTIENTATNANIDVKTNGTGDFIFNDNYYLIGSSTTASMRIDSPIPTGQAKIQFVSSTSFTKMDLEYNENLDELEFTVTDTPLIIRGNENVFLQSTAGNLSLEASGSGSTGIIEIESDEALILKSNDDKIQVESGSGVGTSVISLADTSAARISRVFVENDSPVGSIAATGGDLTFRDDGVESAIYLKKSDTSSDDWYTVSVNPPNMIEINNAVELAALATASVITISENTTFVFHNNVTTLVRFVLTDNATLYFVSPPQADYNFAGTGTLFSGTGAINISDITFVAYAGGTFMELVSNNDKEIVLTRVLVGGFKLGSITKDTDNSRGPAFTMQNVRFFGWNTTLVLTDLILLAADNFTAFQPNEVPRNIPCINIKTTVPWIAPQFSLQRVQGSLIGTETLLEVDSGISTNTRVQITNSPILGDNLFETASTATGIFTAVADASKSAEAITSVIDSGGEARFAIAASGATVEVGQWVVHSGFTTNTDYNGNFIVTATTGHTYHVSPYGAGGDAVAFGSNETGTLNTDSVEITDASHGLSEGDSLYIYTNDAIDYDDGYQVLSGETTDTFRINAVWTQTRTGTWSNGGLNHKNPHVLANNNPGFPDSKYIGSAHVNSNSTATTIISVAVWEDLNLNNGAVESSNNERWKLIDPDIGKIVYSGKEPFSGNLVASITGLGQSGQDDYEFRAIVNGLPISDGIVAGTSTNANVRNIFLTAPIEVVNGDTCRGQIRNTSGTDNFTITEIALNIQ
ncbi:MAG: hypothetical protein GY845_25635 [Planctomycetes bacterium]|nr:hypothetical protein [Planctomycetota bacterium]